MASREQRDAKRQAILEATLQLLMRGGATQISTTAVFRAAGVSRTTFYRHFTTREALLAGVMDYTSDNLERRLEEMIQDRPDPADRLEIVLDLMMELLQSNVGVEIARADPGFLIKILDRTLGRQVSILNAALTDVYATARRMTGGVDHSELVSNLMTRLLVTLTFLPSPAPPGDLRQIVRAVFQALMLDLRLGPENGRQDRDPGGDR